MTLVEAKACLEGLELIRKVADEMANLLALEVRRLEWAEKQTKEEVKQP